ncbi:MAG TPA: hypothetical protein VHN99_04085, partial [Deinococcales bacterium]|nr:hypothetical protein [Deinococcales bacterium]
KLTNRQHGLTVVATKGTDTLAQKDLLFTSQGPATAMTGVNGMPCNQPISQNYTLYPQLTGTLPDEIDYDITRDNASGTAGRGGGTVIINPDTVGNQPTFLVNPGLLLNVDDLNGTADPVPMTLTVKAVNRDFPSNLPTSFGDWTCHFTVPKSAAAAAVIKYFDEFDHKADNWGHLPWESLIQNPATTFAFNYDSPPPVDDLQHPTFVAAHTTRGPMDASGQTDNSRFVFPLYSPLTEQNTFQFWMVFRVTGRSPEPDEWKVGRVGLVSSHNTTPSEGGYVRDPNNNISSVQFEIEAQFNYVAGFFAMVNLGGGLPDCQNTMDPACARRDTRRVSFDPTVSATDQTHPTAGFDRWMKVTCTYTGPDGTAITGLPAKSFVCSGRNDEDNIDLGSTGVIQLGPTDTFSVDEYGLFDSGRPTPGAATWLDWQAGRTMLTVWKYAAPETTRAGRNPRPRSRSPPAARPILRP